MNTETVYNNIPKSEKKRKNFVNAPETYLYQHQYSMQPLVNQNETMEVDFTRWLSLS